MRDLERNKQTLYYATYTSKVEKTDGDGKKTGEWIITYSNPIKLRANISASRGTSEQDLFGVNVSYSKAISTSIMDLPITETTIFYIDTLPTLAEDGSTTTPHDYVLAAPPAKSLNNVVYAVENVKVSK